MTKLRIPPPVQGVFWAFCMWGIYKLFPNLNLQFTGQKLLGLSLIGIGLGLDLISIGAFLRAKTTINPIKLAKTSHLVTSGLYRLSRNPMYLGLACLLTGWAILLGNPINLLILGIFILLMNMLQIIPEEQILLEKFGHNYRNYQSEVKRWI